MLTLMNNISPKATTWIIDSMHSAVGFCVRHLMVANARGFFRAVNGIVRYDASQPELTAIRVEIAAASLDTRVEARDAHLRNADFFDVENYPVIAFRSTGVRVRSAGGLEVAGDLTIRATTRAVRLSVVEIMKQQKDHNGRVRMGASATATIKRSDFGITYNRVLEAGGIALADDVALTFDMSLVQADADMLYARGPWPSSTWMTSRSS
jgi:polyisoprenoid-binding protein YceI